MTSAGSKITTSFLSGVLCFVSHIFLQGLAAAQVNLFVKEDKLFQAKKNNLLKL
jgi:hypothetical protein